jgi:chemotaxis protein MotD
VAADERKSVPDPEMAPGALRRETHLQPLSQPAQQVADAVGRALVGAGNAPVEASPISAPPPSDPRPRAPLNVLQVTLQPADLGAVMVRLRLAGDVLEVSVVAERKETAELLRHDRDHLAKLLKAHGYDVANLSVEIGRTEAPGALQASPQMQSPAQQQQQAQSPPQAGPQTSPGGGQGDRAPQGRSPDQGLPTVPQENRFDEEPERARRGGGDLYV